MRLAVGNDEARAAEAAEIATLRGHVDSEYYGKRYPDIDTTKVDPLEHYVIFGWKEGRDPCEWFSTRHYLARHRDVSASGVNPFLHYILFGKDQDRKVWAAGHTGGYDLAVDPKATLVADQTLLDLIRYKPQTLDPSCRGTPVPALLDLHWVIPDFDMGSGGHMTIFRMIRHLELAGHTCTVWIMPPARYASADQAYDEILRNFQTLRARVAYADEGLDAAQGDAIIATGWQTVARVMAASKFRDRFYLVQDYEPSFHPTGSHALAAGWTYTQDLACICASPWLAQMLQDRYGRWTRHFSLAYDKKVYAVPRADAWDGANTGRTAAPPRVALYARRSTARRAVELALLALEHLAQSGVEFHADLFGEEMDATAASFPCTTHGILDAEALSALYQKADVGICFSTTNYSLIPQEMMACGLPVLEIDGESTRSVFPDGVVTLTGPHPLKVAEDLNAMLADPRRRRAQADAALSWVSGFNWEASARMIEDALFERLGGRPAAASAQPRKARRKSPSAPLPKATVCIPTYQGGATLGEVVTKVCAQRAPWAFDIVIVDSGSTDGSIEAMTAAYDAIKRPGKPRLLVKRIQKQEFQHGRTRNLCASLSTGEFIAFLTQDAMPASTEWLYDLVTVLEHYQDAAGAFGRHIAWPSSSPFTKRDIAAHFDGLLRYPAALSSSTDLPGLKHDSDGRRQVLHYFSDNCACLRRSAWEVIPYPEADYGEDQAWAEAIVRRGWQKVYVATAAIYHSHDYGPGEAAERAETEAYFFTTRFGYSTYDEERSFSDQLAEMDAADTRWALENKVNAEDLEIRLRLNKATLYGRAQGMRHAKGDSTWIWPSEATPSLQLKAA